PGLSVAEMGYFTEGQDAFNETDFVTNPPPGGGTGLGPQFNSDSCGSCHAFPSLGGSSPMVNPQIPVPTKLAPRNRSPPFLRQNGPVLEVRFKSDGGVHDLFSIAGRSDAAGCNAPQTDFSNTGNLSFRIPTPTFGLGLIEAIPDSTLKLNLALG